MFKALKERWQQAKKQVEEEQKAQSARPQQPAASESGGAYVGEVMRRHYGGKWELRKPEGVLQLVMGEATAFPLRRVQKRILNGPVDHIPHYFNGIAVALKS